ncbi:metallophosphoesterase [Pseudoroseicyclus sp. H15]
MKSFLSKFFRAPTPSFDAPLAPDQPLALIGDVHGCDTLLDGMLTRLDDEAPGHQIVLLGDYIDRGEQSAQVLRRLIGLQNAICLMGNHEAMCLDFLEKPRRTGDRWLRNGGLQTLASFGIGGLGLTPSPEQLKAAAAELKEAMGPEMITWMERLRASYISGNVAAIHAGGDPEVPIEEQDEAACLWGAPGFMTTPRQDGMWVVHGHVIVPEPSVVLGRIALDTGAYATGCLTAALINGSNVHFLQHRNNNSA